MIDLALSLLEDDEVAREIAARMRLVAVDELQDTSPLQLALFARLHRLAGRSVWVGDWKQCIFEYAGADPGLMEAVAAWVGPKQKQPKTIHHHGYGTFVVDGRTLKLKSRMA